MGTARGRSLPRADGRLREDARDTQRGISQVHRAVPISDRVPGTDATDRSGLAEAHGSNMTKDAPLDTTREWGIEVRDIKRPDRGTNNLVWYVNDAFVLRVHQNITEERVGAEHRLLEALRTVGLPFDVPEPLRTANGRTVVSTADGPAALYPLLPGRSAHTG